MSESAILFALAGPVIGSIVAGLLLVSVGQTMRAAVDIADYNAQMLRWLEHQAKLQEIEIEAMREIGGALRGPARPRQE